MISLVAALALPAAHAQSFLTPIEGEIIGTPEAYVISMDGDRKDGQLGAHLLINGSFGSIHLLMEEEKEKFKASEMQAMAYKPSRIASLQSAISGATTIQSAMETDFNEVLDREYVYFVQAQMPGLLSRSAMLQILNPGFNERIEVYNDPDAEPQTSRFLPGVIGTGQSSYLVSKDGGEVFKVKKRGYRRKYNTLFSDCEAATSQFEKVKYRDMAAHVFAYSQACGTQP